MAAAIKQEEKNWEKLAAAIKQEENNIAYWQKFDTEPARQELLMSHIRLQKYWIEWWSNEYGKKNIQP